MFGRKYGTESPGEELSSREIVSNELLPKGHMMLDIGCGSGKLCRLCQTKYDMTVGIDIMKSRLRCAMSNESRKKSDYIMADMDIVLPFRQKCMSSVVCVGTFEYAYDPVAFLSEINRILELEGIFVFQVSNLVWLPRRLKLIFGRFPATGAPSLLQDHTWNGGYLHAFTMHETSMLLRECGFRIIRCRSSGHHGRIADYWPSMLSPDLIFLCKKVSDIGD